MAKKDITNGERVERQIKHLAAIMTEVIQDKSKHRKSQPTFGGMVGDVIEECGNFKHHLETGRIEKQLLMSLVSVIIKELEHAATIAKEVFSIPYDVIEDVRSTIPVLTQDIAKSIWDRLLREKETPPPPKVTNASVTPPKPTPAITAAS